jgi:hypothetical protein
MNLVCEGFDRSIEHFKRLYGAEFMVDLPQKEWHAALIGFGRVLFELFIPYEFLLNSRYGPHFVGVEYQADIDEVREVIDQHGIRLIRDIGMAVHTHPDDCFGVAFEFYGDYFHDREWPLLGGRTIAAADYWRDTHPLGLTGMKGYGLAVHDLQAAGRFLEGFISAAAVYEDARPGLSARAIGMQVADAVIEVMAPTGEGALRRHLDRFGQGVCSTIFKVRDLDQARDYFTQRGVNLVPGFAPNRFAVDPAQNLGAAFEFEQQA